MISEFSTKKREWYHLALLHLLLFWSHCLHKSSLYGQSSRLSSPPPLCKYLASTSRTYRWSRAVFLLCAAALLAHSRRIPFRAVTYLPIPIPFFLFYGFSFSTWRPHKKSWLLNGTLTLTCSPAAIQGASRSLQLHVAVSCKHQRVVQIFRFICVRVTPLFFCVHVFDKYSFFLSGRSMLPTFPFLVIYFTSCSAATRILYTATDSPPPVFYSFLPSVPSLPFSSLLSLFLLAFLFPFILL